MVTVTWIGTTPGSWYDVAKWAGGSYAPSGTADSALFGPSGGACLINQDVTLGSLTMLGTYTGSLYQTAGSVFLVSNVDPVFLISGGTYEISGANALTATSGGIWIE